MKSTIERNNAQLVSNFSLEMLLKLNENNHKGHWSGCSNLYLFKRLIDEAIELQHALNYASPEEIIRECADVANFAAMIADNYKQILQEKQS